MYTCTHHISLHVHIRALTANHLLFLSGNNYDEILKPMLDEGMIWPGLMFLFYHCFVLFAMMNVL